MTVLVGKLKQIRHYLYILLSLFLTISREFRPLSLAEAWAEPWAEVGRALLLALLDIKVLRSPLLLRLGRLD